MLLSNVKHTLQHPHLWEVVERSSVVAGTSEGEIFVGCELAVGTPLGVPP